MHALALLELVFGDTDGDSDSGSQGQGARGSDGSDSDGLRLRFFDRLLRFVERPSNASAALSVKQLEMIKRSARHSSYKTNYCGMDRWYDNHFGYVDDRSTPLFTRVSSNRAALCNGPQRRAF